MSIEAFWYECFVNGNPPKMRRLCRLPMADQWRAAIDIAISFSRGEAGYRKTYVTMTRECYWFWPAKGYEKRSPVSVESDWWLIPRRVDRRVFALYDAAVSAAMRVTCDNRAIITVLERWQRNGHWRKVAASVLPRTSFQ